MRLINVDHMAVAVPARNGPPSHKGHHLVHDAWYINRFVRECCL